MSSSATASSTTAEQSTCGLQQKLKKCDLSAETGNEGAAPPCAPSQECIDAQIRENAYLKWEAAGYPAGDGAEYWIEAEQEYYSRLEQQLEQQLSE